MHRAIAALRRGLASLPGRPGIVEAVLRLVAVGCLVIFAGFFGDRWSWLAAGVGLFVVTSERQL